MAAQPKNLHADFAFHSDPLKTHFEIARKTTLAILENLVIDESSPLESPHQANCSPQMDDSISLESKLDNDENYEINILNPVPHINSTMEPLVFDTNQIYQEEKIEEKPEENETLQLDQTGLRTESCLKSLEELNEKLLQSFLKKISTNNEVWQNGQLAMKEIEPDVNFVAKELSSAPASPRPKLKQEILRIKTDLENKLSVYKQIERCKTHTGEINPQYEVSAVDEFDNAVTLIDNTALESEQQLENLQNEIMKAKQELLEFQIDRKKFLTKKRNLELSLSQPPTGAENLQLDLGRLKIQNLDLEKRLQTALNDIQQLENQLNNINSEIEKSLEVNRLLVEEGRQLERVRIDEKFRLGKLITHVENMMSQMNALMPWLEESLFKQPPK